MEHHIKLNHMYFEDVCTNQKTFEIRKNDRNYQVGDVLALQEVKAGDDLSAVYTGRVVRRLVTYISHFMQRADYVVLGIAEFDELAYHKAMAEKAFTKVQITIDEILVSEEDGKYA